MKKSIFITSILTFLFLSFSCNKKDDVNPEGNGTTGSGERLQILCDIMANGDYLSPSFVSLYPGDIFEEFDISEKGVMSLGETGKLINKEGKVIQPMMTSPSLTGENIFDGLSAGYYLLVAVYRPEGALNYQQYYYGYSLVRLYSDNSPVSKNFFITDFVKPGRFYIF